QVPARGFSTRRWVFSAPAGEVCDVPVVSLVAVEVSRGCLPLGVAVAAQADVGEVVLDVGVDAAVVRDVDLVAVPVAVGARRVADLGAAGDVDRAAAG